MVPRPTLMNIFFSSVFWLYGHNRPAAYRWFHAVVVDYGFDSKFIFPPDLYPEGVWLAVSGPNLELVVPHAIDRAGSFELSIVVCL